MFVIKHRKIFFALSAVLVIVSIAAVIIWGLDFSIEFTGGSIIEVSYEDVPEEGLLQENVSEFVSQRSVVLQPSGNSNYILRTPFLEEDVQNSVLEAITIEGSGAQIERISAVGPTIGQELKSKALWAIVGVIFAIILYIAFAFRKVSEPVSSWKYGLVAIVALVHDIIIPTGAFALLGYIAGYEVDVLFVTAILAILGFSVNDTIVVFDRIRENLKSNQDVGLKEEFEKTVGKSLSQTYTRSINTSLTTLLVLVLLLFIGSEATRHFALVLVIGIISGTYSSIFLASPLLVWWNRLSGE